MKKKSYIALMGGCFIGLVSYSMADGNTADLPKFAVGAIPATANPTYKDMCSDCTLPGIYHWGNGALPVYGDNVTINGAGYMGHGIFVNGDTAGFSVGVVIGDNLSVKTSGNDQDGLRTHGNHSVAESPTFIVVGDNARIITTGSSADAINAGYTSSANGFKGSANITLGNRAYLETSGNSAYGISANAIQSAAVNNITLGDDATIVTNGSSSYAVRAGGQGSTVTVGDRATIITNGASGHGISSQSSSHVNLGKDAVININNIRGNGINAASSSTVTLAGGATIVTAGSKANSSYAINASNATVDGSALGVYHIKGDLNASGVNGKLDLNMDQGSTWQGASYLSSTAATHIEMNKSTWLMTDNSHLTSLKDTNSRVNFLSSADKFLTLNTKELKGNGTTFGMNVALGEITTAINANGERVGVAGTDGDLLKIENTVDNGKYKLNVANVGSAATQGNEVLQIVETGAGNSGNFALSNGNVELGAYQYGLRATNSDNGWELYGTGKRTATATNLPALLNTNYLVNYVDTQNLLQRMGELRDKGEGDVWIRGFGGKLNSFAGQNVAGFDMNYKGTQVGVDKRINTNSGEAYVGVMGGMTEGRTHSKDANGTLKDYHLGAYGSYITDNGIYLDAVAKYSHMKNNISIKTGTKGSGKGSSNGYSASLETGKRFHLGADKKSGIYIEPQAQITVGHQDSMSMTASNGLKTELNSYNYAIARTSAVVGYQTKGKNPINIYAKTGYAKEMNGKTSYKLNGQKNNYNFSGSWWDNSIGVSANVNKKHNIYTDLSYAKGQRFDQKQLNVGYRYSF